MAKNRLDDANAFEGLFQGKTSEKKNIESTKPVAQKSEKKQGTNQTGPSKKKIVDVYEKKKTTQTPNKVQSKMSVNDDSYLLNLPGELKSDLKILSNLEGGVFADFLRNTLEEKRNKNIESINAYKILMKKTK